MTSSVVKSKIAGTEILLISETWLQFYQWQPPEALHKKGVVKRFAIFTGKHLSF